jgi:tetratricopeptide (TPR) repeat protein/TolB-like protein
MGVVYAAEDTRLHRRVALKVLPAHALDPAQKSRFLQEARAAAQLHHPNICPIHDVGEHEGQLYYTMALLPGWPLASLIRGEGLPVSLALDIAIQVASGLEQAHERGVVHRDIKPQNLVIAENGHASILDFGLALMGGATRLTQPGRVVGTASYMSPEQADGRAVDCRSDLWALGVVLYEMLSGARPFERESTIMTLRAVLEAEPEPLSRLRDGLPEELCSAVARALAKRPEDRWQSAAEFGAELRRIRRAREALSELPEETGVPAALRPKHSVGSDVPDSTETVLFGSPPQTPRYEGIGRKRWQRRSAWIATAVALWVLLLALFFWRHALPWFTPPLPEEKRVAILPFEVFGDDPALRVLSDGLADTLTAELIELERFQGRLMVIPASEIRTREIRSAEDARSRYAANLVVTGTTQRLGDQVQLTLHLVDSAALRELGARSFHFDIRNPASLRTGAITRLSSLLEIPFGEDQRRAVETGKSERGDAQLAYLQGRGYLVRYDQQGNIDRAIDSFKRATQQDRGYALAFAALAEAYYRKTVNTEQKEWLDLAVANAEQAVRLAPGIPVARIVLGEINAYRGRHPEAVEQFEQALQIAPGSAEARRGLAEVYTAEGRFAEAESAYIEATRRRPQDWYGYLLLGYFYIQRARYGEAEQALRSALELTPDNAIVYRNLAVVFMSLGRYREAREQLEVALRLRPNAVTYGTLGVALYYEGKFAEAVSALETSIDLDPNDYSQWGNLGTAYRWAPGGSAKAEVAFRRAVELGEGMLLLTPKAHRVRANLAEYYAKLGEREKALAKVEEIPPAVRSTFAFRIALVYELLGRRADAIRTLRSLLSDASVLNDVRFDPDLAGLWNDSAFQQAMREMRGKTGA